MREEIIEGLNIMIDQSLQAIALWVGLNLGLVLLLALNATRHRMKGGVSTGSGNSQFLERAVRAHGNNTEYVPGALLGILILVALGYSPLIINLLGASLLVARFCHAHGIQQLEVALPKTRGLGNVLTWALYLIIVCSLVYFYFP